MDAIKLDADHRLAEQLWQIRHGYLDSLHIGAINLDQKALDELIHEHRFALDMWDDGPTIAGWLQLACILTTPKEPRMKKKTRPNPNNWTAVERNVDHPHKFVVVNQATGKDDGSRWTNRAIAESHAADKNR